MSKQIRKNKTNLFYQTRVITPYKLPLRFSFSKKKNKRFNPNFPYFLEYQKNLINFSNKIKKLNREKWEYHRFSKKSLNFIPFFFNQRYSLKRFLKNNFQAKHLLKKSKYVITEKQFRTLIKSEKNKNLRLIKVLQKLENRLDAILFRMGFSKNAFWIRQIIIFGAVLVNGKKVTKPGFILKEFDVISISPKWRKVLFQKIKKAGLVIDQSLTHLLINHNILSCTLIKLFDENSLPIYGRRMDLYLLYLLTKS